MSESGELLRTETVGGVEFEFRRGPNAAYPIVVWRDGTKFGHFASGSLHIGNAVPRIEVADVADLMFKPDRPIGTLVALRHIAGTIWRQQAAQQ